MADFNISQNLVKESEGGYQNLKNDNGNWTSGKIGEGNLVGTNFGISAPTLSAVLGRAATVDDMKNLTYLHALNIYKKRYWNAINGNSIKNQEVANIIYDAYVNQTGWTRLMLEDTLANLKKPVTVTSFSYKLPLASDTISVINSTEPYNFYTDFKKQRKAKYEKTAQRTGQASHLQGWLDRLDKFDYGETIGTIKRNKGKIILLVSVIILVIGGIIYFKR